MDPQTPQDQQTPTPTNGPSPGTVYSGSQPQPDQPSGQNYPPNGFTQPPKKKLDAKKIRMIIVAVCLLVVAGIFASMFLSSDKKENKQADTLQADGKIYFFRDGYDIKNYGSSIGDPLALVTTKTGPVVNTDFGPVVYACNVLTIADMNAQKAYVEPRGDDRGLQQNFIDNVGTVSPPVSPYTLPSTDAVNECMYSVEDGYISLDVYQRPFVGPGTASEQAERQFAPTTSVNGLETYKKKNEGSGGRTYMVRSEGSMFEFYVSSKKLTDDQVKNLLTTAAKNFVALQKTPKGPVQPAYDTPTFKKPYAKACNFISNADIKALTGNDASIYVNEGWATGTSVAKVNNTLYNSLTTKCERFNAGLGPGLTAGPFDQKLEVTIRSFNENAPAEFLMKQSAEGTEQGTIAAGDQAIAYRDTAGQNAVIMRQGRFVVDIMFNRTVQKNAGLQDTAAMAVKLTPYAQQVAAKLKTMQ